MWNRNHETTIKYIIKLRLNNQIYHKTYFKKKKEDKYDIKKSIISFNAFFTARPLSPLSAVFLVGSALIITSSMNLRSLPMNTEVCHAKDLMCIQCVIDCCLSSVVFRFIVMIL